MNGWSSHPGDDRWADEPAWVYEITWEWEPTPGQRYPGDPGRRKAVHTPVYEATRGEDRPAGRASVGPPPATSPPGADDEARIRYARAPAPQDAPQAYDPPARSAGYPARSAGLPARQRDEPSWNRPVAMPERITDDAGRHPDPPSPPARPATDPRRQPAPEARPPARDSHLPAPEQRRGSAVFSGRPDVDARGGSRPPDGRNPDQSTHGVDPGGNGSRPVSQSGPGVYGSARPAPPDAFPAYPDARTAPRRPTDTPFDLRPAPVDRGTPARSRPAPQPTRVTPTRPVTPPAPVFPSVPGQPARPYSPQQNVPSPARPVTGAAGSAPVPAAPNAQPGRSWMPPGDEPDSRRPGSASRATGAVPAQPNPHRRTDIPAGQRPDPNRPGSTPTGPDAVLPPTHPPRRFPPPPPGDNFATPSGERYSRPPSGDRHPPPPPDDRYSMPDLPTAGSGAEPVIATGPGVGAGPEPGVSWSEWVWDRSSPAPVDAPEGAGEVTHGVGPTGDEPHGLGWLLSMSGLGQTTSVAESEVEPNTELEPGPELEPVPELQPDPENQPDSEADPGPEREPVGQFEPGTKLAPSTEPPASPEPSTEPVPEPAPTLPADDTTVAGAGPTKQSWFAPPASHDPAAPVPAVETAPAGDPVTAGDPVPAGDTALAGDTTPDGAAADLEVETVEGELLEEETTEPRFAGADGVVAGKADPAEAQVSDADIVDAEIIDPEIIDPGNIDAEPIDTEVVDAELLEAEVDAELLEAEVGAELLEAEVDADRATAAVPQTDAETEPPSSDGATTDQATTDQSAATVDVSRSVEELATTPSEPAAQTAPEAAEPAAVPSARGEAASRADETTDAETTDAETTDAETTDAETTDAETTDAPATTATKHQPPTPVRGRIRQRRTPVAEQDRRRQDPEQVLAAYPLVFDPATLREEADEGDQLWVLLDRLADRLEYAERDSVRARLLSLRAVAARLVGDLGAAEADGRAALRYAQATGELRLICVAQARLAHVLQWRGQYPEADRLYAEADSTELPARLRAEVHELAGRSAFEQGRNLEAVNHFENALDLRNGADPEMIERIELALDVITSRGAEGWGPYPRSRDEILGRPEPPRPLRDERSGLWGYAGAVPPRFVQAQPFAEGVAWVRRRGSGAWELIDEAGRLLVDELSGYLAAGRFAEGLAWVSRDQQGGWFAIDRQNRVILPGGFDDARPFHHGLALIRRGGWGAIDLHGRVVVQPRYRAFATALVSGGLIDGFTAEGLAVIDAGDRFGVVDRTGQLLVGPVHAAVRIHPAAFLIADKYGLWGALDRRGEPFVELKYRDLTGVLEEIDRRSPDARPVL